MYYPTYPPVYPPHSQQQQQQQPQPPPPHPPPPPSPAQLSYFHFQQPSQYHPPPSQPQPLDFEAYVPEPANPLRSALDAAERQKAKAERLSGTLARVLEAVVTEARAVGSGSCGSSPTLERLLLASSVFGEVLAMQREWDAAAEARERDRLQQSLLLHNLDFPDDIDYFGTNGDLVFPDPSSGELCLRAP